MEDLPMELATHILIDLVDPLNWCACRFVCRRWYLIITHRRAGARSSLPLSKKGYAAMIAYHGWLTVLQWARRNGCPWDPEICSTAARQGHLEILRWVRANDGAWDERTCSAAAEEGRLEILQWARANGCPWDHRTIVNAARGAHLEVLQWAIENGCTSSNPQDAPRACVQGRKIEVDRWIHRVKSMTAMEASEIQVQGRHMEVLQWLLENGGTMDGYTKKLLAYAEWRRELGSISARTNNTEHA